MSTRGVGGNCAWVMACSADFQVKVEAGAAAGWSIDTGGSGGIVCGEPFKIGVRLKGG